MSLLEAGLGPAPRSLVEALERASWARGQLEAEVDSALGELTKEELSNRKAIDEAYRRIAALRLLRQEFEARKAGLGAEGSRHDWMAVRDGLRADRERFMQKVEEVRAAVRVRDDRLVEELQGPGLAAAVAEYERFQTEIEPALATLPPAYRSAVIESQQANRRRLAPWIQAANAAAPMLVGPMEPIGVVACASPADGRPEALVFVLPLPFELYRGWAAREEDLAAIFAYRVVTALFRLLREIGAEDAPVEYFEVHECLALQVWLSDHSIRGDLREQTLAHIGRAYEEGPELPGASVEVYGVWVRPELLTEDGY
ncbi:MAG: hypothetical protein EXR69_16730 [Myxococcales bacterium]|nr:hypothetical protein [Myxococcales bacterium]